MLAPALPDREARPTESTDDWYLATLDTHEARIGLARGLALVALVLGMTRDRVGIAQAATTNDPQTGISVTGTGKATVVPDLGVINLAAQVTRPSVQDARDTAARAMDAVRGALKQQGVADKDIAT